MKSQFLEPYLQAKAAENHRNPIGGRFANSGSLSKSYVAVVDDDELISNTLAEELDYLGYHSKAFDDAESVLELMSQETPDVLLVDYFLPKMNGAKLIQKAQKEEQYKNILFLLMSGYPQAESEARALGVPFLEKPFSVDKILNAITDNQNGKTPLTTTFSPRNRQGLKWNDLVSLFTQPPK